MVSLLLLLLVVWKRQWGSEDSECKVKGLGTRSWGCLCWCFSGLGFQVSGSTAEEVSASDASVSMTSLWFQALGQGLSDAVKFRDDAPLNPKP